MTKLSRKGLIKKERSEKDSRNVHLYVTQAGQELSDLHKQYDVEDILKLRSDLLKDCTQQELDTFYKVLTLFNNKWDEAEM